MSHTADKEAIDLLNDEKIKEFNLWRMRNLDLKLDIMKRIFLTRIFLELILMVFVVLVLISLSAIYAKLTLYRQISLNLILKRQI